MSIIVRRLKRVKESAVKRGLSSCRQYFLTRFSSEEYTENVTKAKWSWATMSVPADACKYGALSRMTIRSSLGSPYAAKMKVWRVQQ